MLQRVLLTKCTKFCSRRYSSQEYFAEKLATRNLVRVGGAEVVPFLQGLMTNDMEHLTRGANSMYTMFLNKAGRVLYDSIVYRTSEENTFLIECDSSVISEVTKHLKLFRVRRKINIDPMVSDYTVWAVFKPYDRTMSTVDDHKAKECPLIVDSLSNSSKQDPAIRTEEIIICADPRVKLLGTRLVVPQSLQLPDIQKLLPEVKLKEPSAMNDYQILRYQLGIAEGVNELFAAKSFPLEVNCDYLHGVSFHKGCYVGQELTARTYHTGVVRKRILPIEFATHVDEKEGLENVLLPNGNSAGKIRGFKGKWGVALLRVEQVMGDSISLMATNLKCSAVRPIWWPQELPTKAELKEQQK